MVGSPQSRSPSQHSLQPHPKLPGWEQCTTCGYMRPTTAGDTYDVGKMKKEAVALFSNIGFKGVLDNGTAFLSGTFTPEELRRMADIVEEIDLARKHECA